MASIDSPGSDGSPEEEDSFLDWDGRATLFDDEEESDEGEEEDDEDPDAPTRRARKVRIVDPEDAPLGAAADLDERDEETDDDDDEEEEDAIPLDEEI